MATPHRFDIVPHVGIGPLHLRMTLAEVDAVIGKLAGANLPVAPGEPAFLTVLAFAYPLPYLPRSSARPPNACAENHDRPLAQRMFRFP